MIGIVISGLKEARSLICIDEYKKQFKEKLGINPYPGTLNFISPYNKILNEIDGILIDGFEKNKIIYGKVKCFPSKVNGINSAILIPEKRKHNHLELISEFNLREKLKLRDGDKITIEFLPFIKKRRKYLLKCCDEENAKIKIYYDNPLIKNPLIEYCNENKEGKKILPSRIVASLIFEEDIKKNYEKFIKWVRKKHSILYPPILIDYGKIKEWQIEIKWNNG